MSEWKLDGETFIYELNQEGSNKWWLNIQPGWSDNGQKLGPEDISDVIDLVLSAKKLQAENAKLRKERDELKSRKTKPVPVDRFDFECPDNWSGEPYFKESASMEKCKDGEYVKFDDIQQYLNAEPKRETVLLSDEQINEVSRNAHEFSELRKRYDFNEDKFLIDIQYAVLKANGIGTDND
jgi:hypothetical protein